MFSVSMQEARVDLMEESLQTVAKDGMCNSDAIASMQAQYKSLVQNVCNWQQSAARQLARISHRLDLPNSEVPNIPFDLMHLDVRNM
jgi:hypothetical protein